MNFIVALWIPILVSGIAIFIASAIAWVVLPHHKSEWQRLGCENDVMDAVRRGNPTAGMYAFPYAMDPTQRELPEMKAKMERGPVGYVTLRGPGAVSMGPMLVQSLAFYLVVAFFIAYVAFHAIPPGAPYLHVFRFAGTLALMAFAFGTVPDSIWFARPWKSFLLQFCDSVVYALLVAGIFGAFWPPR